MLISNSKLIKSNYELSSKDSLNEIKKLGLYDDYRKHKFAKSCYSNPVRSFLLASITPEITKTQIKELYLSGYGIKTIGKSLGLSYTSTRHFLIEICKVELRKGMNVITDKLREFRKNKANIEHLEKTGWSNSTVRENLKIKNKTSRGVQGWYFNNSIKKYVWLRSAYEYIYAKWLDRTNHIWDSEVSTFTLLSGETYRPDFFIYEKNKLVKIIEVKGYFDIRKNKAEELNLQFPDISVILLNFTNSSIKPYTEHSYPQELKNWKKEKITHENNKNNSTQK